jgi:uncharacterized protein (DUF58 family)
MIPKELLRKIRRIQIRTSHVADDVLAGKYHSAFRGRGMEFEEVREYQVGDEIRAIDWNVTARHGHPYVKVYREERELTVMLLVDMSGSLGFGTAGQLKRELAAEICATLAFSAIRNNDKVGLICFTDRIEKFVAPQKGTRHVLRVVRELLFYEPTGHGTDVALALQHLDRVMTRRAVAFVVSDFQTGRADIEKPLRLVKRRHDLIPIIISDPREESLPDVRFLELMDEETGQMVLVDTSNRKFRKRYEEQGAEATERQTRLFWRLDVDVIRVRTGESFVEPLTRFFRVRESRR